MSGMLIVARGDVDPELWLVPDVDTAYRRLREDNDEEKLFEMVAMGLKQDDLTVSVLFVPMGADLGAVLCEFNTRIEDAIPGFGYVGLYAFSEHDTHEVMSWIQETKRPGWSLLVPQDLA